MRAARLQSRGLPQRLPEGERLLWQGAPRARALMFQVFHTRALAAYFAVILAWSAASAIWSGVHGHALAMSVLHRLLFAMVPLVLIIVYAWAIERSTVYSITSRRVVISFGLALPMNFNIPFSRIEQAGLRLYRDGTGDIPLRLTEANKMSYLVIWPHARPWRMARTEPMLRCIAGAQEASGILAAAFAKDAGLADGHDLPHNANQEVPARPRQPTQRGVQAAHPAVA